MMTSLTQTYGTSLSPIFTDGVREIKGREEQGEKVNLIVSGFIKCELRALKVYLVLYK